MTNKIPMIQWPIMHWDLRFGHLLVIGAWSFFAAPAGLDRVILERLACTSRNRSCFPRPVSGCAGCKSQFPISTAGRPDFKHFTRVNFGQVRKGSRLVPMFPELREYLEDAYALIEPGEEFVITALSRRWRESSHTA